MAFYRRFGEVDLDGTLTEVLFPTDSARGPWGPMQHGGPVAALLTRAMSRLTGTPGTRIARVTVDLLGPVPMSEVRLSARVVRPGRRIELLAADLQAQGEDGRWHDVAQGSAWRLATQPTADVIHVADAQQRLPDVGRGSLTEYNVPESWPRDGFIGAVEWRLARAGVEPGVPSIAWVRIAHDLVEGEPISDLERVVATADIANGIGGRLDPERFTFLNTDLTVHLHRPPTGSWHGLEAESTIGSDGIGVSAAVLHGEDGPIGRVAQTVLVERR